MITVAMYQPVLPGFEDHALPEVYYDTDEGLVGPFCDLPADCLNDRPPVPLRVAAPLTKGGQRAQPPHLQRAMAQAVGPYDGESIA